MFKQTFQFQFIFKKTVHPNWDMLFCTFKINNKLKTYDQHKNSIHFQLSLFDALILFFISSMNWLNKKYDNLIFLFQFRNNEVSKKSGFNIQVYENVLQK